VDDSPSFTGSLIGLAAVIGPNLTLRYYVKFTRSPRQKLFSK
jgi:hypothetical protein